MINYQKDKLKKCFEMHSIIEIKVRDLEIKIYGMTFRK